MTETSQPLPLADRGIAIMADLRAVVLAAVAATCAFDPAFALRGGAIVAAGSGVLALSSGRRLTKFDFLMVAFGLVVLMSSVWSEAELATVNSGKNALGYITIAVVARLVLQRRRDFLLVGGGLIVGALYGLAALVMDSGAGVRLVYDPNAVRYTAESLNANYLAYTFATAAFVAVAIAGSRPSQVSLPFAGATALAMYVGIVSNGTRAALLSVALLVGWALFARVQIRAAYLLAAGVMVFGFVATFTGITDGWIRGQVVASSRETGDLNGRLSIWPMARGLFYDRPLLGHGAGALPKLSENYYGIVAHNALLDVAVGVGTVGLSLFVAVLAVAVWPRRSTASLSEVWTKGLFIVTTAPILLTGYWIESPVFWLSVALVSKVSVISAGSSSTEPPPGHPKEQSGAVADVPRESSVTPKVPAAFRHVV